MMAPRLDDFVTPAEREQLAALDSPVKIQAFLDDTLYSPENANRSVVRVLREREAHCLDGGLFAAAALARLGHPPIIVDLLPEPGADDDHVLAIYRVGGLWGAVAKSNFTGLRLREPVFRSLRELVMSYFEAFFNVDGLKTLRSMTRPVRLARFDRLGWLYRDVGVDAVEEHLKRLPTRPLLPPSAVSRLAAVDRISYQAGMLVVNPQGLYKPNKTIVSNE